MMALSSKMTRGSVVSRRVTVRRAAFMGLRPRATGSRRVGASKNTTCVQARFGVSAAGPAASSRSSAAAVKPTDAKNFAMNKGYTLLDIRSAGEHNNGSKRWFVNLPFDSESSFKAAFQKQFPMKSARIIVADVAGKATSAASALAALGYTNVVALEGGLSAYFKVDPLNAAKDKVAKGAAAPITAALEASWRAPAANPAADRISPASKSSSSFRSSGSSGKFPAVKPLEAKKCAMDKGYTLLDIRSAQEHNAASKRWFVNLPFDSESSFKAAFQKMFPMKSARIVLACDDGTDRSSGAASVLSGLGYSNVVMVEGGVNAYLRFDPLGPKDRSTGAVVARTPAAPAVSSGSRFSLGASASPAASDRKFSLPSSSGSASVGKFGTVKPIEAKALALNKGYNFVDVRSPAEHAKASRQWMMNMPVDDPKFKTEFSTRFFNKLARVIIACEDGSTKSSTAANIVSGLGYSNVKILEGGMTAYLKFDPITGKAAKPSFGTATPARPASAPAAPAPAAASSDRFSSAWKASPTRPASAPAAPAAAASDRFSSAWKASPARPASAPAASASSDRFSSAWKASPTASSSSSSARISSAPSTSSTKVASIKPAEAKKFALDKGYILVDVRSASEHARESKKWFVNIPADSEARFKDAVSKQYPFKNARLIIADSTGGSAASGAAGALAAMGYNNVVTLEGGVASYLKYDPLTAKDKRV